MEELDVYDKDGNKAGKTFVRGRDELNEGEYFLFLQTWIFNADKKILLTQRNLEKKCGGMWEPTNGHAFAGEEAIDAMLRELKEELGLEIEANELELYKTITNGKALRMVWVLKKDIKLEELNYSDNEVIDAKYVTIEEVNEMMEKGELVPNNEYITDIYNEMIK